MYPNPDETVEAFLDAASERDAEAALAFVSKGVKEPRRLFQLSNQWDMSGEPVVVEDRAVIKAARRKSEVFLLLEQQGHGWFLVGAQRSQAWAALFLRKQLQAEASVDELPQASEEALKAAKVVVQTLQSDDPMVVPPLNLLTLKMSALSIGSELKQSRQLEALDRHAVAIEFVFEEPRGHDLRWVFFKREGEELVPYLQTNPPQVEDFLKGLELPLKPL